MRFFWAAGIIHAAIGGGVLFSSLHPLRDVLDPHALELARVGGAFQAIFGAVLMIASLAPGMRLAKGLMTAGVTVSMLMLYFIIFTGARSAAIVITPIGGFIALIGLLALATAKFPKE